MNDICSGISGKLIYDNYIMGCRYVVFETHTKHNFMKYISATDL